MFTDMSPLAYFALTGVALSIALAVLAWAMCSLAARPTPAPPKRTDSKHAHRAEGL